MDFKDLLRPIVEEMSGGLGSLFGLSLTDMLKSPSEYSEATATLMGTITSTVILPTATVFLTVLCVVELNKVLLVADGDGETRLRVIIFTLIKFGVIKAIFDMSPLIMGAIYQIFAEFASGANALLSSSDAGRQSVDAFIDATGNLDWLGQAILIVFMLFALLVNKGAVLIGLGLVVIRFVKLYIYGAFAPIPLSFLATQETRSLGLNFLPNDGAVALQGFVMVLGFAIFQSLSTSWGASALSELPDNSMAAALSIGTYYMFMGVVLGMTLAGSGRLANELLGG